MEITSVSGTGMDYWDYWDYSNKVHTEKKTRVYEYDYAPGYKVSDTKTVCVVLETSLDRVPATSIP
jgi:hypothetical protein